jgi:parvulin-like peptidyl-prolyl isomerase
MNNDLNIFSSTPEFSGIISRYKLVFCLAAIFFIISCDKINFFSRPYVATVNGAKIYLDEYELKLNQKKGMLSKEGFSNQPNYVKRFEEEILDSMITEKIMYLRAQELDLSINSAELDEKINEIRKEYGDGFSKLFAQENVRYEQWKEDLKKEMLIQKLIEVDVNASVHVSDDEAEDYFNEHRDKYRAESRVNVSQIVVRDVARAQAVLKRLNDGEDFAHVAGEVSIGPEAKRGGSLGFITRQIMPEPLDETIFSLPVNKISPIVKSPYGFHVFKVLEIQSAKVKSFAESKEDVIADIRAKKEEAAFTSWLESMKMKAVIKKEAAVLRNKFKQ